MAEKLMMAYRLNENRERGFVLVTALVMLSLLTLLMLGMYFNTRTTTQTSAAAQHATEAQYYAETAINYMVWGFNNDNNVELDSYPYTGTYIHGAFPDIDTASGDFMELGQNRYNPGPTETSDATAAGLQGQVRYFDNSPMGGRAICFERASVFSNCIDLTVDPAARVAPTMNNISVSLPRYVRLDISQNGTITPTIPSLPHQNPPVVGQDIPQNGAVVWLTAGDPNNLNRDLELFPLGDGTTFPVPTACNGGQFFDYSASSCPCPSVGATTDGCDAHANGDAGAAAGMGAWLMGRYTTVIYAIGYVNGRPLQMIRAVVSQ